MLAPTSVDGCPVVALAIERRPVEPTRGGQMAHETVGFLLHAAFSFCDGLEPHAARRFATETFGLPESLLTVMRFGFD